MTSLEGGRRPPGANRPHADSVHRAGRHSRHRASWCGTSRQAMTSASSTCPSLGRVRRIAGAEAQESFVGSDLTYEDIGGREFEAYDYRLLDDDVHLEGRRRRRRTPPIASNRDARTPARQFPRVESLVRKDNFVVVGARIFNRRDEAPEDVRRQSRRTRSRAYWTVMAMTMADAQAARTRTELVIEDVPLRHRPWRRRLLATRTRARRWRSVRVRPADRAVSHRRRGAGLYRLRRVLTVLILVGALAARAPRQHHAHRQRPDGVVLALGSHLPGVRTLPRRVRRHAESDRRARRADRDTLLLARHVQSSRATSRPISNGSTPSTACPAWPRPPSLTRRASTGADRRRSASTCDALFRRPRHPHAGRSRAAGHGRRSARGRPRLGRRHDDRPHRLLRRSSGSTTSAREVIEEIRASSQARAPPDSSRTSTAASRSARNTTASRWPTSRRSRRRSCC